MSFHLEERRALESLNAALPFLSPLPAPWRSPPVHNPYCRGRLLFPAAHCVPRTGCCEQVWERARVSSPALTLGSLGLETSSPNSGLARHATISPCPSNLLPSAPRQTPLSERGTHGSPRDPAMLERCHHRERLPSFQPLKHCWPFHSRPGG